MEITKPKKMIKLKMKNEKQLTDLKLRNHSTAIFGLSSNTKPKKMSIEMSFLMFWNVEQYPM